MIVNNCLPSGSVDGKAAILTVLLLLILFGGERLLKKKISPILLIAISACLGILMYGV
jgi:chromate transporter